MAGSQVPSSKHFGPLQPISATLSPRLFTCLRLLALGRDGVNLINEDDGGGILLSLLKSLRQPHWEGGGMQSNGQIGATGMASLLV